MSAVQQSLLMCVATSSGATFDPGATQAGPITLSNGNRTMTSSSLGTARTTTSRTSGKFYFEMLATGSFANYTHTVGVITGEVPTQVGDGTSSWSYARTNGGGTYYHDGSTSGSPANFSNNDVVQVAIDMDAGKIWFGVNGTFGGSPSAGTSPAFTGLSGTYYPAASTQGSGVLTYRPNVAAQTYSPPSGFSAWD